MPELPEVETIRQQLIPQLLGRQCVEAEAFDSAKFMPAAQAVGARFVYLKRRGKYLLVGLAEQEKQPEREIRPGQEKQPRHDKQARQGTQTEQSKRARLDKLATHDKQATWEMILHLGMTGSLHVSPAHLSPAGSHSLRHIRACWWLDDNTKLEFNDIRRFGRIRVVPSGQYQNIPTLFAQGPDALSADFTPEELHRRLSRSKRSLKTQLLSQRPVAGLGNIYADEALWEAGILPGRRNLGWERSNTLHKAICDVLARALKFGGTTLRDYRTPDNRKGSFQKELRCYGRSGEPCLRCENLLSSRVIDGRTTTWCGVCQT